MCAKINACTIFIVLHMWLATLGLAAAMLHKRTGSGESGPAI